MVFGTIDIQYIDNKFAGKVGVDIFCFSVKEEIIGGLNGFVVNFRRVCPVFVIDCCVCLFSDINTHVSRCGRRDSCSRPSSRSGDRFYYLD